MIVGIDEVGRGSWAGPVCVAAVAWPNGTKLRGLADSKKVLQPKRAPMAQAIRLRAADIGIGWASHAIIDQLGMTAALKLAAEQALAQITVAFDAIIIDGNLRLVQDPRASTVIKADNNVPAVMAASLIAKVARDTYMHTLHQRFAQYEFIKHVGYGTVLHRSLLAQFGPSPIHRLSYAPLRALAE